MRPLQDGVFTIYLSIDTQQIYQTIIKTWIYIYQTIIKTWIYTYQTIIKHGFNLSLFIISCDFA